MIDHCVEIISMWRWKLTRKYIDPSIHHWSAVIHSMSYSTNGSSFQLMYPYYIQYKPIDQLSPHLLIPASTMWVFIPEWIQHDARRVIGNWHYHSIDPIVRVELCRSYYVSSLLKLCLNMMTYNHSSTRIDYRTLYLNITSYQRSIGVWIFILILHFIYLIDIKIDHDVIIRKLFKCYFNMKN